MSQWRIFAALCLASVSGRLGNLFHPDWSSVGWWLDNALSLSLWITAALILTPKEANRERA